MGGDDHRCEWRERTETLEAQLTATTGKLDEATAALAAANEQIAEQSETLTKLSGQLADVQSTVEKLQRHVFGQRSEKMPPVAEAIRDPARAEAARISALQKRRENAEKRRAAPAGLLRYGIC